jgi:hypothetical protein
MDLDDAGPRMRFLIRDRDTKYVAWTGRRTYHLEALADLVVMSERVIVEAPTVEVLDRLATGQSDKQRATPIPATELLLSDPPPLARSGSSRR